MALALFARRESKTSFVTPVALAAFGSTTNDEHTVKAGMNYHFNLGGPVAARY